MAKASAALDFPCGHIVLSANRHEVFRLANQQPSCFSAFAFAAASEFASAQMLTKGLLSRCVDQRPQGLRLRG